MTKKMLFVVLTIALLGLSACATLPPDSDGQVAVDGATAPIPTTTDTSQPTPTAIPTDTRQPTLRPTRNQTSTPTADEGHPCPQVDIVNCPDASTWEEVEAYLAANVGTSAFGGKVFCAYEPLDATQGAEGKIYVWALCQEYYLEEGSLTRGSGASLPVALQIQEKGGRCEITGHRVPRDGEYYGPDVRDIFPKSTWSQIIPQTDEGRRQCNARAKRLEEAAEEKARSHFGVGRP